MANSLNPASWKWSDIRVRTAFIDMVMNALLTCAKFIIYFFSGSLAVLAEAWHSYSDIVTSLLVLIAVGRDSSGIATSVDKNDMSGKHPKRSTTGFEMLVSLGIGLLLTTVAILLLVKFILAKPPVVQNSLSSGIIFLILSSCSYFIYRFETRVGKNENSVGLFSDGMHSRADMTASMMAGFSLILYAMGINVDRWVALLIAVFILSFAVETLFNVAIVYFRGDSKNLFKLNSVKIIALAFDKETIKKIGRIIYYHIDKRIGHAKLITAIYKISIPVFIGLVVIGYFATSLYTVSVREQAIIERFGKPLNITEPVGPGLHIKLPWPIDRVKKVTSLFIEEINIGNIIQEQKKGLLWTRKHGTDDAFLSGDNNFFYPYLVLHYRVNNIFNYLYKTTDPRTFVDGLGHQIATALFAKETYYDIATIKREPLEKEMLVMLQQGLDDLGSGIEVLAVNIKDIHPPINVADSFEKVIAGFQEKQQIINEAIGYKNDVIPVSRGEATSKLESATSYIIDKEKRAEGMASRFSLSRPVSKIEKDIAISRIYIKTMRDTLKDKTLIVVDPKSGKPDIWMGFEKPVPLDIKGGN